MDGLQLEAQRFDPHPRPSGTVFDGIVIYVLGARPEITRGVY